MMRIIKRLNNGTHSVMGSNVWNEVMVTVQELKSIQLSGIPKSVLRTCEETLWFFCNSLARFLLLQLLFSCWNEGRVTSGLSLWFKVARAKRRWIFSLLLESARIISIRHNRHVSSERHSRAWLRCASLSNSLSRILMLIQIVFINANMETTKPQNYQTTTSQFERTVSPFSPQNVLLIVFC